MKLAKERESFITLRAEGHSYDHIAKTLGVSRQCLQKWSKDLCSEIENAKAFRMDALRVQYQLTQTHRLEMFSDLLGKIRSEIAQRDLSNVPTDKLIGLYLKVGQAVREETPPLTFTEVETSLDRLTTDDSHFVKKAMT